MTRYILLIIMLLQTMLVLSWEDKKINQETEKKDSIFFKDSIRAAELNTKAGILGIIDKQYTQSLDTFFESLNIRKRIYGDESSNLAPVYNNIGNIYMNLGQNNQAIQYYVLAEKSYLLDKEKNKKQILNLYGNFGIAYRAKLDYSKALQYYSQALNLYKESSTTNEAEIADYSYAIAEIYYVTNEFDRATQIINENINNSYIENRIDYYKLLAFISLLKGNFVESQINFQNSIDLTITRYGENSTELTDTYLQYASFLITNNQFADAALLFQKAFKIIDNSEPAKSLLRSEYFVNMGYYWTYLPVSSSNMEIFRKQKMQNLKIGNNYFNQALDAVNFPENYNIEKPELTNLLSLLEAIKIQKLIADNYSEISDIELSDNENKFPESLEASINTYKIVGSLIQRARKELNSDESKVQLTGLEYSTFYKLIQMAYSAYALTNDENYIDLAFQNAERVKSSSVYDNISDQMALENSGVDDSLLVLENLYNNQITEYSQKLNSLMSDSFPDNTLIKQYNNYKFEAIQKKDELISHIENEYSEYFQLKYSNSMPSILELQGRLKQNQVILEYVLNETDSISDLYSFVVSNKNITFNKQSFTTDFIQDVETMFGFVSNDNYLFTNNDDSKNFCTSSFQLYQNLIEPHKAEIQDLNITIIPDGKLSYIPFDALITSLPDTSETIQFNRLDYLIRTYNINYSNSSNLLLRKRPDHSLGNVNVLAFAPEYDGEKFLMGKKEMSLIPLSGVYKEVEEIAEIVKSNIYMKEEATEENFRKNVGNYDILHFAMHAFINDSVPAFSSLAFSQLPTEDTKTDGLLSTADIYNLKLKAKLVVLSACNTGTGQLLKGEGILSLARGFLYAGCPSIIMSLWEVDDESGTQIMSSFYGNLKKGKTKDEALRAAKLEYLDAAGSRTAHPHYWLSFVSIGDNSPLYISYDYYFFVLLILAFLGITIDQIIRIKKARKKQASL